MRAACVLLAIDAASAFAVASSVGGVRLSSPLGRTAALMMQESPYETYLKSRNAGTPMAEAEDATRDSAAPVPMPAPMPAPPPAPAPPPSIPEDKIMELLKFYETVGAGRSQATVTNTVEQTGTSSDTDNSYERVPWWKQSSTYSEQQRKDRRTIFMHDDWVRHRSSSRFLRNMQTIGSSGINEALSKELLFVTLTALFVVVANMLLVSYQDLSGVVHNGPLNFLDTNIKSLSLPALPFSIAMPALSLLLVFRTNTAYFRWNEARTLWGGLINNCRNIVRQTNTFFPDDPKHEVLKRRMAAEDVAFVKALRNFLRGPTDDETLRSELYELSDVGLISRQQADDCMAVSSRLML